MESYTQNEPPNLFQLTVAAVLATSLFQLFIPVPSIPIAIASAATILPAAMSLTKRGLQIEVSVLLAIAFALYSGLAAFWSTSPGLAFRPTIQNLLFAILLMTFLSSARNDRDRLAQCVRIALPFTLVQPISVLLLNLDPTFKTVLYDSLLSPILFGPNTIADLKSGGIYTALSEDKFPGFFLNANYAGIYSYACASLAIACRTPKRSFLYFGIAGLHYISLFLCGSKASIILAVFSPGLTLLCANLHILKKVITLFAILPIPLSLLLFFAPDDVFDPARLRTHSHRDDTTPMSQIAGTLSDRMQMWQAAHLLFKQHPIEGLGWGGWEEEFSEEAKLMGFTKAPAAHNLQINLWAVGGIPLLVLGQLTQTAMCLLAMRQIRLQNISLASLLPASTWIWIVFQSLGENFGLYGDIRAIPWVAMAIAMAATKDDQQQEVRSLE